MTIPSNNAHLTSARFRERQAMAQETIDSNPGRTESGVILNTDDINAAIAALESGQTIVLRAANGEAHEIDVPFAGTARREILEGQIRSGDYTFTDLPAAAEGEFEEGSDGEGLAPAKSASKEAWVAFAITSGADPDEAAAATKADLIEQYGG